MQPPTVNLSGAHLDGLVADIVRRGGRLRFRLRACGSSMWPVFQAGDRLTVETPRPDDLEPGHIIVYRSPGGRLIAHRLVGKHGGAGGWRYRVRGEHPRAPVAEVGTDCLLGRVVRIERPALGWLRARTGWLGWLPAPVRRWLARPAGRVCSWLESRLPAREIPIGSTKTARQP